MPKYVIRIFRILKYFQLKAKEKHLSADSSFMRETKLENIEFIDSVKGIKESEYKTQVLDYLDLYAQFENNSRMKSSLIQVIKDDCYRLRLAYFARFI